MITGHKPFTLLVFLMCFALMTEAQRISRRKVIADSLEHEKFLYLINVNREQSYITITDGLGNLEPLIMEAKLSPSYFFSRKKKTWAVLLNPQVQIRMQNKNSFPISIPSYKAHLTFFHSIDFWKYTFLKRLFFEKALWSVTAGHHSNGKAGDFYLSDSTNTVNFENGNFSTNYLIGSISTYSIKRVGDMVAFRSFKATAEIHPRPWEVEEIRNIYGNYRFSASISFGGPWRETKKNWVNNWLQQSSLELTTGWIAGKMDGASPLDIRKRFVTDIKYQFYPPWFDEIAFFIRYYRGQDYYNVYFIHDISVLTFGLTSNILNMKQAVKFIGNRSSY